VTTLTVCGSVMGHRLDDESEAAEAEIVRVTASSNPSGPIEDSLILIERTDKPRGRYISWINYFDLEYAVGHHPDTWRIVESPEILKREIDWHPYGWPEVDRIPMVGDTFIAASGD